MVSHTPSLALFEQFTTEPGAAKALMSLHKQTNRPEENDFLDFKFGTILAKKCKCQKEKESAEAAKAGKSKPPPDYDRNTVREIWCQYISAFANSAGGVVVFGMDTDKIQGKEFAGKPALVTDLDSFTKDLEDFRRNGTVNLLPEIKIKPIPVRARENGKKEGFVVCHIPEGDDKPYYTTFPNYQAWERVGDQTVVLPRHKIQRLFYPRRTIKAELQITAQREPDTNVNEAFQTREALYLGVKVRNSGPYSIEHTELVISSDNWWISVSGMRGAVGW